MASLGFVRRSKILIGVGLVELSQLGSTLSAMGRVVAGSLGPPLAGTEVVTQVVIVAFLVLGFLASFLWTRIYYGPLQTRSDWGVLQQLNYHLKKVEVKITEQEAAARSVKAVTNAIARRELEAQTAPELIGPTGADATAGHPDWPDDLKEKVDRFLNEEPKWDSDPVAALFYDATEEANGRRLDAELETELDEMLVLGLVVRRAGGPPLEGDITFLLHPTFRERIQHAKAKGDVAKTTIFTMGSFTCAAILDGGRTVLTYNLKKLPNAPAWFIEN